MGDDSKDFEIALACYKEHSESFRALNTHMWQIPIIAMTLTGGLWYGVANSDAPGKGVLLLLAAISDILFVLVLLRTRFIMGELLNKLKDFSGKWHVEGKGSELWEQPKVVVTVYSIILFLAAATSLYLYIRLILSPWS